MDTILINVDDKSSVKLFMELAKKLHFKARVLSEEQKEDWALLSMVKYIMVSLDFLESLDIIQYMIMK